jgi:hypothetical protein
MWQTIDQWRKNKRTGTPIQAAASIMPDLDTMSSHTIGLSPFMWTVKDKSITNTDRDILLHFCIDPGTDARRRAGHPVNRASIVKTLEHNGFVNMPRVTADEYWQQLLRSKFVASPEGNGIDCHRTYEALWCGCIPIVEIVNMRHFLQLYGNVPVLWTYDYSEITPAYLEREYMKRVVLGYYNFSKLYYESLTPEQKWECDVRAAFWFDATKGGSTVPPNMWESHRALLSKEIVTENA